MPRSRLAACARSRPSAATGRSLLPWVVLEDEVASGIAIPFADPLSHQRQAPLDGPEIARS